MSKLDPYALFQRIAADIPKELHGNLFVTGSLAAAYHFQAQLEGRAVNTKDADLVVHPAGDVNSCISMTTKLLGLGWTRKGGKDGCFPQTDRESYNLRAIRLYPPDSRDYFIELLNLPQTGQTQSKCWIPFEMEDGWYGLPSFRFLGLTFLNRLMSGAGLEYASPSMMALANLLSHPEVGTARIESGSMKGLLRAAKDLGRAIALARLAGREETETWPTIWMAALEICFPDEWKELADRVGNGLNALLGDENAMMDAWKTTDIGLLNGMNVDVQMLGVSGKRIMLDAIEPLADLAKR